MSPANAGHGSTPRPLVVVQILPALDSGGVERGTLELARAVAAAGHRSIVISAGGRLVAQLEREGSEHITRPVHRKSLASLLQIRPLQRLLHDLSADIVHAHSRIPAWIAWLAIRRLPPAHRPHFITTVHGLNSVSAYSAIMVKGEKVIAVSQTVQRYIQQHYPQCPAERIQVIYEGIDPADFPYNYQPSADWLARWQADFPELQGKTVLALPGRLTRLKGHHTFIDLIASLRANAVSASEVGAHRPNSAPIHGLIIGGAETRKQAYADELKARITSLGLSDCISFTGHRDDMNAVISQCQLTLSLTTQPETFGRTVLEALRIGRPVIAWDKGGVGEILRACYPEGLVQDGDTAALKATIEHWLSAPTWPAVSDRFQLSDSTAQTLALYQGVINSVQNKTD